MSRYAPRGLCRRRPGTLRRLEAVQAQAIFLRVDADGAQSELIRGAKYANGDFAAVGSEQFLDVFGFIITGAKSRLARNFTFYTSGPRAAGVFQCGAQRKFIENGRFRSEGKRRAQRSPAARRRLQLLQLRHDPAPLFRLALGGIRSLGSEKKSNSCARRSGVMSAKFCSASLPSSSACASSFMRYCPEE